MKRVIALLALLGAVAFGAPAWADDKAAAPAAPVATATAAADGGSRRCGCAGGCPDPAQQG